MRPRFERPGFEGRGYLAGAVASVALVAMLSLCIGAIDITALDGGQALRDQLELLWISRVPRTLALLFAGAAMAVAGLILQMLLRNRYVEPTLVGTAEGACLGLLLAFIVAPDLPVWARLAVATAGALAVTALFLALLARIPLRSMLVVPLVGIVLTGIFDAVNAFIAHRFELLQSLAAWGTGDFSQVLEGRWELLWIAAALTLVAAFAADRFTIAGLGRDVARGLGLAHGRVLALGLVIVSAVSACVVVTVGVIPFLGLVVPNAVSLVVGDNLRRTAPLVALTGAGAVLVCDLIGRLVRWPYEIPVGVVIGALGSVAFLALLRVEKRRGAA